jgi:5-formyltetrahydrofolate cyclo-ligase
VPGLASSDHANAGSDHVSAAVAGVAASAAVAAAAAQAGMAQRLAQRKAALRKELKARRAALSATERSAAGRALLTAILDLPETGMAGTVAAYLGIGTEPQTEALVFALWKRGSYVLLPVVRPDHDLDWATYEGPDSLARVPGPLGLLEPTEPPRGTGAIASADLVLVPALAADRQGNRLGRGAGCYDRALARVGPAVPTIALLYDHELIDQVPAGSYDQTVGAVAQPRDGITWLGGRRAQRA